MDIKLEILKLTYKKSINFPVVTLMTSLSPNFLQIFRKVGVIPPIYAKYGNACIFRRNLKSQKFIIEKKVFGWLTNQKIHFVYLKH